MQTRLQYLLGKLAEEAAEVGQMAIKTKNFGLQERRSPKHATNEYRLVSELKDLALIVSLLEEEGYLNPLVSEALSHEAVLAPKREKVEHYYQLTRQLGNAE